MAPPGDLIPQSQIKGKLRDQCKQGQAQAIPSDIPGMDSSLHQQEAEQWEGRTAHVPQHRIHPPPECLILHKTGQWGIAITVQHKDLQKACAYMIDEHQDDGKPLQDASRKQPAPRCLTHASRPLRPVSYRWNSPLPHRGQRTADKCCCADQ